MESKNVHRRRFFKRAAIATLIGSVAAGIGFKTLAQGGPGSWHRRGFMAGPLDAAMVDERIDRMLKHLYVKIEATEEQKGRLAPIVKDAVKDLLPLRERVRDARKQAIELLAGERVDRDAIEHLRSNQIAIAEQASKRLSLALADAAEVLTPAQRKALAERVARHRGRHHG